MKVDSRGKIAYHYFRIENDGMYLVQKDFDGGIDYEKKVSSY